MPIESNTVAAAPFMVFLRASPDELVVKPFLKVARLGYADWCLSPKGSPSADLSLPPFKDIE